MKIVDDRELLVVGLSALQAECVCHGSGVVDPDT
jgi:hypothetical protein